jgi:hypothetical protein
VLPQAHEGKPEIVTNRDTYRAKDAKRAIGDNAESVSCVFSISVISSTPPASTNFISIIIIDLPAIHIICEKDLSQQPLHWLSC